MDYLKSFKKTRKVFLYCCVFLSGSTLLVYALLFQSTHREPLSPQLYSIEASDIDNSLYFIKDSADGNFRIHNDTGNIKDSGVTVVSSTQSKDFLAVQNVKDGMRIHVETVQGMKPYYVESITIQSNPSLSVEQKNTEEVIVFVVSRPLKTNHSIKNDTADNRFYVAVTARPLNENTLLEAL